MRMRTRVWLVLSGTLGAHVFGLASGTGSETWWTDTGRWSSALMLLAAVRHPGTSEDVRHDQQVVVHDAGPARDRIHALLGRPDDLSARDRSFGGLAERLPPEGPAEPWTVVSRLTPRRADQVVAYLKEFGVRAERADDPRVKLHLGILRAVPVVLACGALLAAGLGAFTDALPFAVRDLALVATWCAAVLVGYVVVDLLFAGRPARPSDWEPVIEVTGPYDVELLSLPDDKRAEAIRALREVLADGLQGARGVVDAERPVVVQAGLSRVEARRVAQALESVGGSVVVVRRDERTPEPS